MAPRTRRPRTGIAAAALLVALAGPAFSENEAQVWAFVKVVDKATEGQKLEIQLPIEIVRDLGTLRFFDPEHKKVIGTIDGALIYRTYKDLPIGKEQKVATVKDKRADLALVISSKERHEGTTSGIRLELFDRTTNQNLELAYSYTNLETTLRNFFEADVWGAKELVERIEGLDQLSQRLGPLADVPPYPLIRLDGAAHRLIIKTE